MNLYSDAQQFCKYHAKGRFRGVVSASLITVVTFTGLNGWRNGLGHMMQNKVLAGGFFLANLGLWYAVWSRNAGFNNQVYNEF